MLRPGPAPDSRFHPVQGAPTSLKTTLVKAALLAPLLLTLLACGGGGGSGDNSPNFNGQNPPPPPPPPPPGPPPPPPAPPPPIFGVGNGSGATYQDGAINASQTSLKAGETATLRVNVVVTNRDNEPPTTAQTVTFSSTCAANGRATFGTVVTVSPGLYQVLYTNTGCDGADTVTATLTTPDYTDTANLPMIMVGPDVLTVSFVSSTHTQLSLAGIGGNESTEMTFKVAGAQGVPVIGKQVNFSINTTVGGASILAGRETAITDQEGLARTVLNSGTVAGPVNVRAVHAESGKQGLSSDIIISTGVPVSDRFSLSYDPFNPVGAFDTDGVNVRISVIASDVFGNNPTEGTRVSFVAPESGNVQSSCLLVDGACSVNWRSTAPRPADMRVEVIAYTDGAENFVDNNGNSLYDLADGAITDTGEPYADENENGAYDLGEFFFDTNRNNVRDTGNALWDGPCLDKVNPAAVCTGNSTVTIYKSVRIVMPDEGVRFKSLGTFPPSGTPLTLQQGTSLSMGGMILADTNTTAALLFDGNPLPIGTTVAFSVDGGGVSLQGLASTVVPNAISPEATGFYGATIVAAPVVPPATIPTGTSLLLTVSTPGRVTHQFRWPIIVTP